MIKYHESEYIRKSVEEASHILSNSSFAIGVADFLKLHDLVTDIHVRINKSDVDIQSFKQILRLSIELNRKIKPMLYGQ